MVTKVCEVCGKEYEVKPSHAEKSKYCSRECQITRQKTSIHKQCAFCEKDIEVIPTRERKYNFCSRECNIAFMKNNPINPTIKICEICGKEYIAKTVKGKYCSIKCKEIANSSIIKKCIVCGKEFKVKKYRAETAKTCSRKCADIHQERNKLTLKCKQCGKEFTVAPSRRQYENHFCSLKCLGAYNRDSGRALQITLNNLAHLARETSIEKAIREWLETHQIIHQPQFIIGKYCVDFYLPDYNVIIEAYGDYFHANPNEYGGDKKPLNEMQLRHIKRDSERIPYLKQRGHSVYCFWERDIKKDLAGLMAQITELKQERVSPLSLF